MYLVDTNVWLERLLDQERADEVRRFLARVPSEELHLTDFALHSIAVILSRLERQPLLDQFVRDTLIEGAVGVAGIEPTGTAEVAHRAKALGLDFDDAYQYAAAERYDLTMVSFDTDFDRTERGRKTPADVLDGLA